MWAEGMGACGWTVAAFSAWGGVAGRSVFLVVVQSVFSMGHQQEPPWVGLAALAVAVTVVGISWERLHQPRMSSPLPNWTVHNSHEKLLPL